MKFSITFGVFALLLGGYIFFFLPSSREVESLNIFLFKLTPFFFATFSISLLDVDFVRRLKLSFPMLLFCFLTIFTIFMPKVFYYHKDFDTIYYFCLIITPFIILTIALAYRLGGGSTGNVLRLAFIMLCLMISGIEDLAYLTLNEYDKPIPEIASASVKDTA